jgi:transposase
VTLQRLCPQIAEAQCLLTTLHTLVAEHASPRVDSWLEQCEQCGIAEVVRFAQGVRRDYPAVHAALGYAWSQGQTEGQVNRLKLLKLLKRQLYGRAGFDLLRRRAL